MTYCVGLRIKKGLVMMSDTRTNAGVDNISTFCKMRSWEVPGERMIILMSAGNLATTQAVTSVLEERAKAPHDREGITLLDTESMFQTARLIGDTVREVIAQQVGDGQIPTGQSAETYSASFILGGQVKGGKPRLFMIYPEGNFIEASDDNPFFQIGEHKYGKPILVRAYNADMSFEDAAKLLFVSFDSTLRSNLTVGLPLDLQFYETDSLKEGYTRRINAADPDYHAISVGWSDALRNAFHSLPDFERL